MPRKELFETWAAALHIDHHFAMNRRIADIAAGHGLLAWSLLLLDEERRSRQHLSGDDSDSPLYPRTAGAIPCFLTFLLPVYSYLVD